MKNLKIVLSLLPAFALAAFTYFAAIGFSANTDAAASEAIKNVISKNKPSSTVMLYIILTDSGGNHCLGGSYTYCINGGPEIQVFSEAFYAEVPCGDERFTICVSSGKCWGSYTGTAACNVDTFRIVDLSPDNSPCKCGD